MARALLLSLVLWSAGAAGQIPVLHVSPISLTFTLDGGSAAPPQQVRIRNLGSGTLRWAARPGVPWLRVLPSTGTGPAVLSVEVDRAQLKPGRYEGRITVDAPDADDSPVAIAVAVDVAAAPAPRPSIPAPPPAAGARSDAGPTPGGALPGQLRIDRQVLPPARRNLPYAQAIPVAGGTPPYTMRIVEGRLPAGLVLSQGSIAGTARVQGYYPLVVSVTDASKPPASIVRPLGLRVIILQPDTALVVAPPSLSLRLQGRTRDGRAALAVRSGQQRLEWTAGVDVPWIRLAPASGISPATIEIIALAGQLQPGTHLGTVTVTMEGAPNSPASVPVQVTVPR